MPEDGAEPLAQESSNAASGQSIRNLISDLVHQLSKTSTRTGSPFFFLSLHDFSVFKQCGLCHARWSR